MVIGTYISITTLNVNELNAPTKRQRLAEWIQKQDPYICCLQESHFRLRDTYRLKVRGWKKIFHTNGNQKKAGVAILISDKIDFKIKTMTKDKEGHYIMIKGPSLVAQWLRVCLLMQGTQVRALVWEDPTCHGATRPVSHNY